MNQELKLPSNSKLQLNLLKTLCQKAMVKYQEEQIQQKYYHPKPKKSFILSNRKSQNSTSQPQQERICTEVSVKPKNNIYVKKNNYCWNSQDSINEKNKQLTNLSLKVLKQECQFKEQPRFHIPKLSLGNERQIRLVQLNKQLQSLTSRQSAKRQNSPQNQPQKKSSNDTLLINRQRQLNQMYNAQKKMVKYIIHQNDYLNEALIKLEKSIDI